MKLLHVFTLCLFISISYAADGYNTSNTSPAPLLSTPSPPATSSEVPTSPTSTFPQISSLPLTSAPTTSTPSPFRSSSPPLDGFNTSNTSPAPLLPTPSPPATSSKVPTSPTSTFPQISSLPLTSAPITSTPFRSSSPPLDDFGTNTQTTSPAPLLSKSTPPATSLEVPASPTSTIPLTSSLTLNPAPNTSNLSPSRSSLPPLDDAEQKKTTTPAPPSTSTPPATSSKAPTTPSSTVPPTTSSTPAPTTPAPTPTSPTTPPTPAPTTPTPAPTSAPTDPTTAPTTPTPSPPAPPLPKQWIVKDPVSENVCIVASMDITFKLHSGNNTSEIPVNPSKARVTGGLCGNGTTQNLQVSWPLGQANSSMIFIFSEKDKSYFLSGLNLTLAYNTTKGIQLASFSSTNLTLFETSVNSSYSCASTDIPEQKNNLKEHVEIKVTELQYEAFKTGNTTNFNSAHYCPGEVPDIVPLVVGICLAVLVLVVVIAYLIGRRRSQASGYLSM